MKDLTEKLIDTAKYPRLSWYALNSITLRKGKPLKKLTSAAILVRKGRWDNNLTSTSLRVSYWLGTRWHGHQLFQLITIS